MTLIPVVFALLHAAGIVRLGVLQHLDDIIFDARLRATMPRTLDERIVIVDLDEKSLAELGWPWSRNKLAALVNALFERQKIRLLGFDIVFAEADESSGLAQLQQLAHHQLRDQPGFAEAIQQLRGALDFDATFAQSLRNRPVVLGYYFSSDRNGRTSGVLPAPVVDAATLQGRHMGLTAWSGYNANISTIAAAAPNAGFFNAITDADGVVRSLPLLAEHQGHYYESLSLGMFRLLTGQPRVTPGFSHDSVSRAQLDSLLLQHGSRQQAIPTDARGAVLVPFRGSGGPDRTRGGSYRYVSAADVLSHRLPDGALRDKIVLVGTTVPGLLDLRVTPVGETYPGVEIHANVLSGLMDGNIAVKPDYAIGYDIVLLLMAGLTLAWALPRLSALRAVALSVDALVLVVGLNGALYLGQGLVLPLAAALWMVVTASVLNMAYGYFVESRSKRELAHLFGTYVPPELVDEMLKHPHSYTMRASNQELTVMFCDIRGFTQMSEHMEPLQLQAVLNGMFSRLTAQIRAHHGTIDKYMGDCVMAFWGAPVATANHAHLSVHAALDMVQAVQQLNSERRSRDTPEISIGIGLNTGSMCVGDMGSNIRRSYTVIGDAVNLGARLEGLSKIYGVTIVVSASTRAQAPQYVWQELDKVRVKGKEQAVAIYTPLAKMNPITTSLADELQLWDSFLSHYRTQNWALCGQQIVKLQGMDATKYLYRLYAERVASMRMLPPDPAWDGATNFETK
ncbi:MAG: adenylate/guanylate cyclase domain-containing protein [Rhodoferax sp.]|uniref:CHASE2 domain-containing protein n=1 Tax=Rhodoferax sp. TaxID=50421 RepID=UPI0032642C5D